MGVAPLLALTARIRHTWLLEVASHRPLPVQCRCGVGG